MDSCFQKMFPILFKPIWHASDVASQMLVTICLIMWIRKSQATLPNYTHLHTEAEIMETHHVILNKLNVCAHAAATEHGIFIAIKSAVVNIEQRKIVRQTWLIDVMQHEIPYVFVLGATLDSALIDELLQEDQVHKDLLIGKPIDNYYNLTLKSIFILNWSKIHCSNRWLLYVDDDAIVNVKRAIALVASLKDKSERVLYCHVQDSEVIRDPNSKWYVPVSVWASPRYPIYCHGLGSLISPKVLLVLQKASIDISTQPKLWIEDVYVNGIAAQSANVTPLHSEFYCCGFGGLQLFEKNVVLGQMGKTEALLEQWNMIIGSTTRNLNLFTQSMLLKRNRSILNGMLQRLAVESSRKKSALKRTIVDNGTHVTFYILDLVIIIVVIIAILVCRHTSN
jgi:hypothetical protein